MEKLEFPDRITVELTNQCNVSCSFCPRQEVPMKQGCMDVELFKKIVDEAAEHLPVKLVLFFRGESLLHPHFMECLRYAKQKGIGPVQFASNGLALTDEIADEMLEAGIDFISFSLDTLDSEVYKRTRQHGDLKISMQNVINLSKKCKARRKKGMQAPTLQVSTIELEDYTGEQEAFVSFWKQHADRVRVYYEHDDKGQFRDKKVEELLPDFTERKPCRKVFTDFLIYWNGDLAVCNYDWRGELKGLNVKDCSIYEAWHSAEYEKIRAMQNQNTFTDTVMCKDCQHWKIDYVPGGFLGRSFSGETNE